MFSDAEEYAEAFSEEEAPLLRELARETRTGQMNPRMLSGHLQGSFLAFLSRLIHPVTILEIGTYTGYSAICLCAGLQPGGRLHTIDIDDEVQEVARTYFTRAGLSDRIVVHTGDALSLIPRMEGPFDLVFLDGSKRDYPACYEVLVPLLRPGGWLLADNVLWGGKVLHEPADWDQDTKGIMQFNERVKNDSRVSVLMLPLRDGLSIIRRNH